MQFSTYMQSEIGHAGITPGTLEAGTHATLGSPTRPATSASTIRAPSSQLADRIGCGQAAVHRPQGSRLQDGRASNGAALAIEVNRNNIRPWVNTLLIRVARGFLRQGDRSSSARRPQPGLARLPPADRLRGQFCFKIFVDAFATYDFVELPESPRSGWCRGRSRAGRRSCRRSARAGEPFRLALVGEDRWGNPSEQAVPAHAWSPTSRSRACRRRSTCRATAPRVIEGLRVAEPAICGSTLAAPDGVRLTRSNPLRIVAEPALRHYWGDLHGQSSETVGTGTAADYFASPATRRSSTSSATRATTSRSTTAFWAEINRVAAEL